MKRSLLIMTILLHLVGCIATEGADSRPSVWPISYELTAPASVSLAIYDEQGRQVRTLITGERQTAGAHALSWDGVDHAGNPAPPGSYRWRLLAVPGFEAKYLTTIGTNPGKPTYQTWFGNHAGPRTVAVTATGIVAGGDGENVPSYACATLDGSAVRWLAPQHLVAASPISLASTKQGLFDLVTAAWDGKSQARVYRVDPATGAEQSSFDVKIPDDKVMDYRMDADDQQVAVSYAQQSEVRWFDAAGALQATSAVPQPGDLALDNNGKAYVISAGRVLLISRSGAPQVVIDQPLLHTPVRVAFDRVARKLWLAEGGTSHQVKRFAADGTLEQTFGRPGGRVYGAYQGRDFLNVTDLCPDGVGGIVVTEGANSLCRMVRISAKGEVLREWFGSQQFYNFSFVDPGRTDEVWFYGGYQDAAVAKVDWATGDWRVIRTFHFPTCDGIFPSGTETCGRYIPRRIAGNLYLIWEGNNGPVVLRVDELAGRLVPVAAARDRVVGVGSPAWAEAAQRAGLKPDAVAAFTWADHNHDGEVQSDEITVGGSMPHPGMWSQIAMANDGSLILPVGWALPWNTLANLGQSDAPRWDLTQLRPTPARFPEDMRWFGGSTTIYGSLVNAAGDVYLTVGGNCWGDTDQYPAPFPSSYNGSARLVKWDKAGTVQWSVGRHSTRSFRPMPPGEFHRPVRIVGEIKDCVVVADQAVRPASVWSTDGLYVGDFLDRRAQDGLPERLYHWWNDPATGEEGPIPWDCLQGGSIATLADGRVVWLPMGAQNTPVYAISGWDGWVRRDGAITIAAPAPAITPASGLVGTYFANPDLSGEAVAITSEARLWFGSRENLEAHVRSWDNGPIPGIAATDAFSARWTGAVRIPYSERYRLLVVADPASRYRVWCDGALLLDTWDADASPEISESIEVPWRAGAMLPLVVEYAHRGPAPLFSLCWEGQTQDRQRIPAEYLYPGDGRPGTGLRADYRGAKQELLFTCIDAGATFNARQTAATAVRWSGQLLPRHAQGDATYQFSITGSGAARLWVDDHLVLDAAQLAGTAVAKPVVLSATRPSRLVLDYVGEAKPAIQLLWAEGDGKAESIPQVSLVPATIATGRGLTADYSSDAALTTIVGCNEIATVDLQWDKRRLPALPGVDVAGVVLHAGLMPSHASGEQTYTLRIQARGTVELLLNGTAVAAKPDRSGDVVVAVKLLAGRILPFELAFHAAGDAASLRLLWSSDGLAETLVPARYLHPLPSTRTENLLSGLPLGGSLANDCGWHVVQSGDVSGWRTTLSGTPAVPVIALTLSSKADVKVEHPLNPSGKAMDSWWITTRLSYPDIYPNHGADGQYLRILDREGRAIIQLNPLQAGYPDNDQLIFNQATMGRMTNAAFRQQLAVGREVRISVEHGQATLAMEGFPPLTAPLADEKADWSHPAMLQLHFTQAGAIYTRNVQVAGLRFCGVPSSDK